MNLDHDFVQVSKLSEDQKKKGLHQNWNTFLPQNQVNTKTKKQKVFTKNVTLFFPEINWTPTLRCTPASNYLGGDADVDHTQTIGEIPSNHLGGYIPHLPARTVRNFVFANMITLQ